MKKIALLLFSLLTSQSCRFENEKGELIFFKANPSEGFNYPYFLFIPEGMRGEEELALIVEPNNSGFADDDFEKHVEKAGRTASLDFYLGNYVARKLKYPLLVPVFPRSKSEWRIYSHAYDRDIAIQKNNPLERIDLQLLSMVNDAEARLRERGYKTRGQILLTGFSASGSFVNRFTAIHPEKILATAAGGINGLLIIPLDKLKEKTLDFPLGTNDFQTLFGKPFDSAAFISTPQYYYMGESDSNDAIPYEDGYDINERNLVFELLGKEMHSERWNSCINIYQRMNVNARFKTYDGIGHENSNEIKQDIYLFFSEQLNPR